MTEFSSELIFGEVSEHDSDGIRCGKGKLEEVNLSASVIFSRKRKDKLWMTACGL